MSRTIRAADHIIVIGRCPCCGADDLDFESAEYEGNAWSQNWFCSECEAEGHDWYDLTSRVITKEN